LVSIRERPGFTTEALKGVWRFRQWCEGEEDSPEEEDVAVDCVWPVINPTAPPPTIPVKVARSKRTDVLSNSDFRNLRVYFWLLAMTGHTPY